MTIDELLLEDLTLLNESIDTLSSRTDHTNNSYHILCTMKRVVRAIDSLANKVAQLERKLENKETKRIRYK